MQLMGHLTDPQDLMDCQIAKLIKGGNMYSAGNETFINGTTSQIASQFSADEIAAVSTPPASQSLAEMSQSIQTSMIGSAATSVVSAIGSITTQCMISAAQSRQYASQRRVAESKYNTESSKIAIQAATLDAVASVTERRNTASVELRAAEGDLRVVQRQIAEQEITREATRIDPRTPAFYGTTV